MTESLGGKSLNDSESLPRRVVLQIPDRHVRLSSRLVWFVTAGVVTSACSSEPADGGRTEARSPLAVAEAPMPSEVETVVRATRASASSEHAPSAGYTFSASNLIDGALNTSWQPAKSNRASTRWVRLEFENPVTVTSVAIANGFQTTDRFGDEFLLNHRISTGRLRFGAATEVPIRFASDARGFVRFDVPRQTTRVLEIVIDETHAGTKWDDVAVSEVEVTGVVKRAMKAAPQAVPAVAADEWWTPPRGSRKDLVALAHGFAGIDEKDLGAVFTSDLKPVHGAPHLFEQRPPRRVPRDGMQHFVLKLRDSIQLDAGFRYLILQGGGSYQRERDYQLRRALQVKEVVRVDESARMRRPPEDAVFYLAEVHLGASFDLLVEGAHSAMGAQLDVMFVKGAGAASFAKSSSSYRLHAEGLGLRDLMGDAIFSMTPAEMAQRYRAGTAVPVQLVFRSIPGRIYHSEALPIPVPAVDEAVKLQEHETRSWPIPPGRYVVKATSDRNGFAMSWSEAASCDRMPKGFEYKNVNMQCTVGPGGHLRVTNPSTLGTGPAEIIEIYVARQH